MNTDILKKRAEEVRSSIWIPGEQDGRQFAKDIPGAVLTTITILSAIYSASSPQLANFQARIERGAGDDDHRDWSHDIRVARVIESVLKSAVADLDAGLGRGIQIRAKGEVLGDFTALARDALGSGAEGSRKVAAVLVAAALEETLKQLGEAAGLDVYGRDMRGVIQKLKDAEILTGSQPSLAFGLSKFRDNSFHGQFDAVSDETTESALIFVEGLLARSFA